MKNTRMLDQPYITALDIGTNKIAMIVGKIQKDNNIEIISACTTPAKGMKKGVVINIEDAVDSIQNVLSETEIISELNIESVYVGIAGSHINSFNCEGMAPIQESEVSQNDVKRATETAQAMQLPADQMILHVLSRDFAIDDQNDIKNPIGMSGYRLLANVHMITAGINPVENVKKCVKRCQLKVEEVVLEQLASSLAVLDEDEKELGVCLVDIGGGTSDIAVFNRGAVVHTSVIPIGGDHVTNDISVVLRSPVRDAEGIKINYGCALESLVRDDETIEVPGIAGRPSRPLARSALARVIEMRYRELFELIKQHLKKNKLDDLAVTGIVLTGGSSKIEGACELATESLGVPVRLGRPQADKFCGVFETVNNPIYATGLGLLLHAAESLKDSRKTKQHQGIKSVWHSIVGWLKHNF